MNLGIEIGGSKLQLVLGDDKCRILDRHKSTVDASNGAQGIREQIHAAVNDLRRRGPVRAVGVGFGGPVDWQAGRICRSHQVEGWSGFDLRSWLSALTGAPVQLDNDANVAALGEAKHGAGSQANPVLYVTLGSGVGGGLVVDGEIYHGAVPGESEIGHLRLDRAGTIVESRCSGWAVDARIRELIRTDPRCVLSQLTTRAGATRGQARLLGAALQQHCPAARRVLEETAGDLAFALSHAVHLFHPEVIIIGGGLSNVGEPLRAAVQDALKGFVMDAFAPGPRLTLAALGEDAVPVGALELARVCVAASR